MNEAEEATYLVPARRVWPRVIILVGLTWLFWIGNPWWHTVFFGSVMALWLGSFPRIWVDGKTLQREFLVLFMRVRVQTWSLERFVGIETDLEKRFSVGAGMLAGIMLGVHNVLIARALDWAVPLVL